MKTFNKAAYEHISESLFAMHILMQTISSRKDGRESADIENNLTKFMKSEEFFVFIYTTTSLLESLAYANNTLSRETIEEYVSKRHGEIGLSVFSDHWDILHQIGGNRMEEMKTL